MFFVRLTNIKFSRIQFMKMSAKKHLEYSVPFSFFLLYTKTLRNHIEIQKV